MTDDDNKPVTKTNNLPQQAVSLDGFVVPHQPIGQMNEQVSNDNFTAAGANNPSGKDKIAKPRVGSRWFLILFIILFIIASAALIYFYEKYQHNLTTLKSTQTNVSSLQQQLLNYQRTLGQTTSSLQQKLNTQADYITSLNAVAQQLKTKCDKACANIVIPVNN